MARSKVDPRPCEQCGKIYTPYRPSQKFCSVACAQRNAYDKRKAVVTAFREGKLKPVEPDKKPPA